MLGEFHAEEKQAELLARGYAGHDCRVWVGHASQWLALVANADPDGYGERL
jgi:hypothetical protein